MGPGLVATEIRAILMALVSLTIPRPPIPGWLSGVDAAEPRPQAGALVTSRRPVVRLIK
jgi:hypothetical protein